MFRMVPACVVAFVFTCAAPQVAHAQWALTSCTTLGKNLFVREVLSDLYLWSASMPRVNPARYRSPEAYLEAVRYRPLDSTFSYITSRAASDAFYSNSQFIGLGLTTSIAGLEMRVMQVFPESPASEAGLARGHRIVAINGMDVAQLIEGGSIDSAFGPSDAGVPADIVFVDQEGARRQAHMVKRPVTIPTVSLTHAYEVSGRRVAYIFFRNFVQPSYGALDAAFAELAGARMDDLVLDLRYNGGGLVGVAQHLASLIGGVRTNGQVFAEYFHNDKNAHRNEVLRFEERANALGLDRLIVITTRASASASELVINALRPFIPVVVIGERTYGKPVGQYQVRFCDKMLAPVSFSLRNANGEGDFFGGFAPTCAAADDADHQLGDRREGSLREALTFATTGACTLAPPALQRQTESRRPPRAQGWQSVVNAY